MAVNLTFPTLAGSTLVPAVTAWVTHSEHLGANRTWHMMTDSDGAIGLIPTGPGTEHLPALLIETTAEGGFDVTACDPDAPIELGTFGSINEALDTIAHWLQARRARHALH